MNSGRVTQFAVLFIREYVADMLSSRGNHSCHDDNNFLIKIIRKNIITTFYFIFIINFYFEMYK